MAAPASRRYLTPGRIGWFGVIAVVGLADGYALARKQRTMSDDFADHRGWGVFILAGTAAHLLAHNTPERTRTA